MRDRMAERRRVRYTQQKSGEKVEQLTRIVVYYVYKMNERIFILRYIEEEDDGKDYCVYFRDKTKTNKI